MKVCIYTVKKEKKCPNKCKKPKYVECVDKKVILSLLQFRCQNCKEEIKYNDVQKHLDSGCETNLNTARLVDSIYVKKKLKKLTKEEINNIALNGKKVNHLSSKI